MSTDRAELWWLPVGAGGHLVIHTSRWWELLQARREHRPPRPLFHAALGVFADERRYVIEMTPAWGQPADARGIVTTGPVGLRLLGHLQFFRYEIRAWPDGVLPDRVYAVDSPISIPLLSGSAHALWDSLPRVPTLTWGRKVPPTGDMWNSNSLISWLLTSLGIDATQFTPPADGRAPGWAAGIAQARTRSWGRSYRLSHRTRTQSLDSPPMQKHFPERGADGIAEAAEVMERATA